MSPEFRQMVADCDEVGLEGAYYDDECPHFFAVDWRQDDAEHRSSQHPPRRAEHTA